jgi:hypothetical protein
MTGLFASLTPEQRAAVAGYTGPDSFGDPKLPKRRS